MSTLIRILRGTARSGPGLVLLALGLVLGTIPLFAQGGQTGLYSEVKKTGEAVIAAYDDLDKINFPRTPEGLKAMLSNPQKASQTIDAEQESEHKRNEAVARHNQALIEAAQQVRDALAACAKECSASGGTELVRVYQARIDSLDVYIETLDRRIQEEDKQGGDAKVLEDWRRRKASAETQRKELIQARDREAEPGAAHEIDQKLLSTINEQISGLQEEAGENVVRARQSDAQLAELRRAIPAPSRLPGLWVFEDPAAENVKYEIVENNGKFTPSGKLLTFASSASLNIVDNGGELTAEAKCGVKYDHARLAGKAKTGLENFQPNLSVPKVILAGWSDKTGQWSGTWMSGDLSGKIMLIVRPGDDNKESIELTLEPSEGAPARPDACKAILHRPGK